MSRPCTCSTSVYVQNLLAAHAFAVVWRLICTFCHPSLTSYDVSYFYDFSFFMACSLQGLDFAWLWALLLSTYSFAPFCSLATISCYTTLSFLLWCYLGLLLILLSMTQYDHWVFYYIACGLLCPIYFSLGHPLPICFPWASSAIFSNSAFSWVFTNFFGFPLGFPSPITLSFILGAHELSISPLLSLLALLHAWCGLFSLFYITSCP